MIGVHHLAISLGITICGISLYVFYRVYRKDEDDDFTHVVHFKTIEIKVPKYLVRELIGRNGSNIKKIQEVSGTHINFSEHKDEHFCIIRGSNEGCHVAENLVNAFIKNQPKIEIEDLWIPKACTGKLIGRQGENIVEMQRLSGAKIKVNSDDGTNSDETRVSLTGTKEQIVIGKSLVSDCIEKCRESKKELEITLSKRAPRSPPKSLTNVRDSDASRMASDVPASVSKYPDVPFDVYVSAVENPSCFWIQIVGPKSKELDSLVERMTTYYDQEEVQNQHRIENVSKGDLVAAIFPYDNRWYRAEVLEVVQEPEGPAVDLYYVDYGDKGRVCVRDVYELKTDFLELHFQAIECYLANVEPVGETWSPEAVDKFEDWTYVAQWKKLSAKINGYSVKDRQRAIREGSPIPGIDLFESVDGNAVNIADKLVANGFAKIKENPTKSND